MGLALPILFVTLSAPLVSAQSTRVEQITDQQAAKAKAVDAEASPKAEVVVKRIMSSPLLSGSGGVYPWFGSIYNGTGLALGAGFLHRGAHDSRVNLVGAGSINGSLLAAGDWQLPRLAAGRVQPWVEGRWSRLNAIPYHGVGPSTSRADRREFDYRPRTAGGGVSVDIAPLLSATGGIGYLGFSTSGDAGGSSSPLTGLGESLGFAVTRAGASLDWRPSPGYATRGGFVQADWTRHSALDDRPYSFDQLDVSAGHLIPLVREYFGLAFRVAATTTHTADGDDIPFILLPSIGGGDTVRALANRRFHDRSRMVANVEYRWRPSRYVDMALFADTGTVAPRLRDIDLDTFETGYGIGVRFHGPTFTAFRVDVARGREGLRLVFGGSLPF